MFAFSRSAAAALSLGVLVGVSGFSTAVELVRGPGSKSGSLISYAPPGGATCFALALRPENLGEAPVRDHVLLIDTSASQAGEFRRQTLAVLRGFLKSLPATERVQLFAVDVELTAMTDGFIAPQSPEAESAVASLAQRVPLGAAELLPAIEQSLAVFEPGRNGSIVYVGDGMSAGGLIAPPQLRELLSTLRKRQVAFHSFAVGPRVDTQLLGVLAEHTGGVLLVDDLIDDQRTSAAASGQQLAQAATAAVLYPDSLSIVPAVERVLPQVCPPLRMDRDTILLGTGDLAGEVTVEVKSGRQTLNWQIRPTASQRGNTYLTRLWAVAEASDGLTIAVAGTNLLHVALQEFEDDVAALAAVGKRAVQTRQLNEAEQIAWTIRQIDPENDEADLILTASQKIRARIIPAQLSRDVAPPPAAGIDAPELQQPGPVPGTAKESDVIDQELEAKRVRGQQLNRQVQNVLSGVDRFKKSDPGTGLGELKRLMNTINSATDIDANDREGNRMRVQRKMEELMVLERQVEQRKILALERLAQVEAQRLTVDQLVLRDERLYSLIEKVRALMFQGFSGDAQAFEQAEAVARNTIEIAPYHGVSWQSIFVTEAAEQLDRVNRLRLLRSDKFLETLYMVEKAHVPFPDEPPLLYPDPEVWQQLTQRRKKWASVDLAKYSPPEEKLRESLSQPTDVNFQQLPLRECIEYLEKARGIDIYIDEEKISSEGQSANLDQEITLQLAGVSFRSILKLLLEGRELTWLIEDEVMKITTKGDADGKLQTRVYPVGDLVIPIIQLSGGGGGGFGGGGGGLGGGLGGQGGGGGGGFGGGGGGFGGGGQGGGGGGGLFTVPSPRN